MKFCSPTLLTMALWSATLAGAATLPAAVVDGVQAPAWIERVGRAAVPLTPGMELQSGDQVRTGLHSRLLVRLSEGSLVKLGENASLQIAEMDANQGGLFRAALRVARGAFRFTTEALGQNRRRQVNISVSAVTAGIRGTDLWGKADSDDKQVVCLIEGKIEVGAQGEKAVTMDQPLQFYRREHGTTQPVGFVPPEKLKEWAKETELTQATGVTRRGGKFHVTLVQSDTVDAALLVAGELRAAGYAGQIFPARVGENRVYQVRIVDLANKAEAQALAEQLRGKYGVVDPQ